jgi:hypothetical protein
MELAQRENGSARIKYCFAVVITGERDLLLDGMKSLFLFG